MSAPVICHAPGERCHGCDHYAGKADKCRYAPSVPFDREQRYVVVKIKDANTYLSVGEKMQLEAITAKIELGRRLDGKRNLECVCVESDWPEYDPTWKAIEARMIGGAA